MATICFKAWMKFEIIEKERKSRNESESDSLEEEFSEENSEAEKSSENEEGMQKSQMDIISNT